MEKRIVSLFTRSPLHVGAGNSVGTVDAPIQRERHTRIPIIPGSSLKGVLADLWETKDSKRCPDAIWLFGNDDNNNAAAGALLVGEARVLAFPVRSAKNSFAWITCPLALSRLKRDSGATLVVDKLPVDDKRCLASAELALDGKVILEEYRFEVGGACPGDIVAELKKLGDDEVWATMPERLAIVSDEIFSYFVENACEVVTRIKIDDETGTVAGGALFNQELVPSETLLCAVVAAQDEKGKAGQKRPAASALGKLADKLAAAGNVIQAGGDATVGFGFCAVSMKGADHE